MTDNLNMFLFQFYEKVHVFVVICLVLFKKSTQETTVSAQFSKVWGPGLNPDVIAMPARYFFIQAIDTQNNTITSDLGSDIFDVALEGISYTQKPCRIWTNYLNRKDGSYIIRYKVYEPCNNLKIIIKHNDQHVGESPYEVHNTVYPDDCDCSEQSLNHFLDKWKCGNLPKQIVKDLEAYKSVDWTKIREKVIRKFDKPHSISLCHYVIKNNVVYRKCYGKYVGFKMFMDSILLSLSRKAILPDLEFFVNLGDWPLVSENSENFPIFSWCGSTTTHDIVMPTYDITESSLENMGRVMLDMLSVQGNVQSPWDQRIKKAFWRGRDSNQFRLDLISIAKKHPELFNASLTNFFFFRDKQDVYGPKSEHVSFFSFFDYKYQLGLDGTVAAYRFPYLLAGGSLVIKQESQYYEHFYNDLVPNTHYIQIKRDLSDIVEKIRWAINNDEEARIIALNGRKFVNNNLLSQHIFCYYAHLLHQFSTLVKSEVTILEGMEQVEQTKQPNYCDCKIKIKDEL